MNGFNLSDITDAKLGTTTLGSIYLGSTKLWPLGTDYSKEYLTFESLADNNRILWKLNGDMAAKTIEWSTDKTNWTSVTASTSTLITTLNTGDKVYIKGSNASYGETWGKYNYFSSDNKFNVYGNIMSLIHGDNFIGNNTLSGECHFYFMFYGSKVVDASNLILPNACQNHTYSNMFNGCTSLINVPLIQQTTTAYQSNVSMFNGCRSLLDGPILLASHIEAYSYQNMFDGCISLRSVTVYAENLGSYGHAFDNWLHNVSPTGTFTKKASMTLFPEGASGIPSGWTVVNV